MECWGEQHLECCQCSNHYESSRTFKRKKKKGVKWRGLHSHSECDVREKKNKSNVWTRRQVLQMQLLHLRRRLDSVTQRSLFCESHFSNNRQSSRSVCIDRQQRTSHIQRRRDRWRVVLLVRLVCTCIRSRCRKYKARCDKHVVCGRFKKKSAQQFWLALSWGPLSRI